MNKFEGKIQGGRLLAKSMAEKGIKRVFSLPGGFINPIYIGCEEYGIEVVRVRSEQEAGFLANGWAQVTREPTVAIAEPSGVTNYVSAVAEAYISWQPVIFLGIRSIFHRLDQKGFKEIPEERILEPITKYSILINDGQRIPEFFDKAYDIAVNQPTGPVFLSIPINFLYSGRWQLPEKGVKGTYDRAPEKVRIHRPYPNPDDVKLVKEELKKARKPVIIASPEVYWAHAEEELMDFADRAEIPVLVPPWHNPPIDLTRPSCMGLADIHINHASRLIGEEADLVLILGGYLDYSIDFGEPPLFNDAAKMITVNNSPRMAADNHRADIQIVGDLKAFVNQLKQDVESLRADPGWITSFRLRREEDNKKTLAEANLNEVPVHPLRLCLDVLHSLGEEDYVVIDGGDIDGWFHTALQIWSLDGKKVRGIFHSGAFHQLGVGVSFATAAKMSHPESKVVLVSGDGTFGLNPGLPLETAIYYQLPITVVVSNDARWGQIEEQQDALWGRHYATDSRLVPFHEMIKGAGVYGELVEDPNDLKPALERCFSSKVPSLIDVRVSTPRSTITQGLVDKRERSSLE